MPVASSIQYGTGLNQANRCLKIATRPARSKDLRSALNCYIAKALPVDFKVAHFDVRMNDGLLPYKQHVFAGNGPVEVPIDAECVRELQVSGNPGTLVEKARDLF